MSAVNTTDVLGSDGVSASRNRINSNITIHSNWINDYADVFGIDKNNGILNLTAQTTGKVAAKIGAFNNVTLPAAGVATVTINSAGVATFVTVNTQTLSASGAVGFSGSTTFTSSLNVSSGATANFSGQTNVNGRFNMGPSSSLVNTSLVYSSGLTAGSDFPDSDTGGGGYGTTSVTPYVITATENIIYANLGSTGGFLLSVGATGDIPAGFELTIINTNDTGGSICTGVTGGVYTGFNTSAVQGGWSTGGITVASGFAYRSSLRLLWEPRIDQASLTQSGSWVALSATNMTI